MLESPSISVIIGLIERVSNLPASEDLAKLDDDLGIEKTVFFNIVDDAERLGLVKVEVGNISLTEKGWAFSKANIHERKKIMKQQIQNIEPIRTAVEILKEPKYMHKDEFKDKLKEKLALEDPEHVWKVIINWGRYTRMLGYSIDSDEIYVLEHD